MLAAVEGNVDVVRYLIDKGANYDIQDQVLNSRNSKVPYNCMLC